MKKLLAQTSIPLGKPLQGIGQLGLENQDPGNAPGIFNKMISTAIGVMTIVAFVWFLFKLFIGALGIISAGSDKTALENARNNIVMGIIGLVVVVSAIFIADLIGNILGIENLLNPAGLLETVLNYQ